MPSISDKASEKSQDDGTTLPGVQPVTQEGHLPNVSLPAGRTAHYDSLHSRMLIESIYCYGDQVP